MADVRGRTILVTRSSEDADPWAAELATRGARAIVFPCIACEPLRDPETAATLGSAVDEADWLALTSVRGAHGVAELVGARRVERVKIAVVGEATAEAARRALGHVDLIAPERTSRSLGARLAREIRDSLRPDSTLVVAAGAESARRDLEEALDPLGVQFQRVAVYRTVPAPVQQPREDLEALGVDTIFLASPSAVTGLMARATVPKDARIVTIGPSTSAAVRDAGLRVDGEAVGRGLEAMIEATP